AEAGTDRGNRAVRPQIVVVVALVLPVEGEDGAGLAGGQRVRVQYREGRDDLGDARDRVLLGGACLGEHTVEADRADGGSGVGGPDEVGCGDRGRLELGGDRSRRLQRGEQRRRHIKQGTQHDGEATEDTHAATAVPCGRVAHGGGAALRCTSHR